MYNSHSPRSFVIVKCRFLININIKDIIENINKNYIYTVNR